MRGRVWSNDICSVVVRASKLGVGPMITEAIAGISKQSVQRTVSEPERCDGHRQRHRCIPSRV